MHMNSNENASKHWNSDTDVPRDPLADALRREAMQERPAFSADLHARMLHGVREPQRGLRMPRPLAFPRWIPVAAAATLFIAITVAASWVMRTRATSKAALPIVSNQKSVPANRVIAMADIHTATSRTIDLAGQFSRGAWPPPLTVRLPVARAGSAPAKQNRPVDSPKWVLADLTHPSAETQDRLNQAIPPEVKILLSIARAQQ
jgi:hypothetical protein